MNLGSSKYRSFIVAILLACLLVALAGAVVGNQFKKVVNGGKLTVDTSRQDFGEVWSQEAFRWSVPITNTNRHPVIVERILTSCTCTAVSPRSFVLAPQETKEVQLMLDLKPPRRTEAIAPVWDFHVHLAIDVLGESDMLEWELRGRVRNALLPVTDTDIPYRLVSGTKFAPKTIKLSSPEPVRISRIDFDHRKATVKFLRDSLSSSFEIQLVPSTDLPLGEHIIELKVHSCDRMDNPIPPMHIRVTAHVVSQIQIIPESLYLGFVQIGKPVEKHIVLRSRIARPFQVWPDLDNRNDKKSLVTFFPPKGETKEQRITLRITPGGLGTQSTQCSFKIRFGPSEEMLIPFPIWYVGTE